MPESNAERSNESRPPESQLHTSSFRAVSTADEVKVYNGAGCLPVSRSMSFDAMDPSFSSVDLLAAAVLSEVLLCVKSEFERRREDVMDLEGRANMTLANPLAAVGVRGIEGVAEIDALHVDVYLFTFLDEGDALALIHDGLKRAVLYHSLKKAFPIEVRYSFAQ